MFFHVFPPRHMSCRNILGWLSQAQGSRYPKPNQAESGPESAGLVAGDDIFVAQNAPPKKNVCRPPRSLKYTSIYINLNCIPIFSALLFPQNLKCMSTNIINWIKIVYFRRSRTFLQGFGVQLEAPGHLHAVAAQLDLEAARAVVLHPGTPETRQHLAKSGFNWEACCCNLHITKQDWKTLEGIMFCGSNLMNWFRMNKSCSYNSPSRLDHRIDGRDTSPLLWRSAAAASLHLSTPAWGRGHPTRSSYPRWCLKLVQLEVNDKNMNICNICCDMTIKIALKYDYQHIAIFY